MGKMRNLNKNSQVGAKVLIIRTCVKKDTTYSVNNDRLLFAGDDAVEFDESEDIAGLGIMKMA